MKDMYVKDLKVDNEVLDFFSVKMIGIKKGSNGKFYLDIVLGDKTGEVSAKKWDISEEEHGNLLEIKEGDIVRIKGLVTEWNGSKQIRIGRIRKAVTSDGVDMSDFIKVAPEPAMEMYQYIWDTVDKFSDEDLKKLCKKLLTDEKERLMYYPAAQKNHHAQMGGLLYHMKRMMMTGERICEVYRNLNKDLVLCGVVIHDIEKLNGIESDEYGVSPGYSFEGQMLGHIIQGVKTIDRLTLEMGFPREKAIMLEHMILSHHYEPDFGSPKKPLFPEAEILHYLDIVDARMFDFEEALEKTEPGSFSDRIFTLDNRKIYKPEAN